MEKVNKSIIPRFVTHVTTTLEEAGFEAYLVGGCVRDLIMGRMPYDWDITTNAHPEKIQEIFRELKTVYENTFGTVTVINIPADLENREISVSRENEEKVQITTYRSEGKYSDTRHPDAVSYETDIKKDLERRDFTINAIALDPIKDTIVDPFDGIKDIKDKMIKAVLYPSKRFKEDALRMLRAVRFAAVLNFSIDPTTLYAIEQNNELLKHISEERIREEFLKIINSSAPAFGISLLEKTNLLRWIIPELYEGIGCEQKGAHVYDVYHHLLHALQHAADKGFSTEVRLATLFHDIGKPRTRRWDGSKASGKGKYTFYGHEVVGAKMTKIIMDRLKFSRENVSRVTNLVRNHMFFSDTEQITLSAVRRIIQKVGAENIWLLMQVRECDRVGMRKVEAPYRLRKYHAMIEEALHDPISVGQLKIDGNYLINELHMKPGPRMGWILHALLEEVLENPAANTTEMLSERAKDLDKLEDAHLKKLGEKGEEKKEELQEQEIQKLHEKHGVK